MSVVAKILIVLNLVLAIVFLGAAATFLGAQESWKVKYEEFETAKLAEIATLTLSRDQDRQRYNDQRVIAEEASGARDTAQEVQRRIEAESEKITGEHNKVLGDLNKLSQVHKDAVANIDKLTNDLKALTGQKDQAIAEKADAVKAMNDAITEQRRLKAQVDDRDDTIAGLEKTATDLAEQIEGLNLTLLAYKDKVGDLPPLINMPAITAKVSSVSEKFNIIMLSVGRDDGVKPGFEFTIYRGTEYIAKVIVDKVEKDYCSGYSKEGLQKGPIKAGDDAKTRF